MDLQELRGMSPQDAINAVAADVGIPPSVIANQWKVESSNGQNLIGPETKWGKAKGHFQVLDGTHENIEKRTGLKLDRMDFTESLYEYGQIMKENMVRYGNVPDAVAAYHGGWNKENWGPVTQSYVARVTGETMAVPGQSVKKLPRNASLVNGVLDLADPAEVLWDKRPTTYQPQPPAGPAPDTHNVQGLGQIAAALEGPRDGESNVIATSARVAKLAETKAATDKREGITFWGSVYEPEQSIVGAAYNRTLQPAIKALRGTFDAIDQTPDLEWQVKFSKDLETYKAGWSDDEWAYLRSAPNEQEFNRRRFDLGETRNLDATMASRGVGYALAGGLAAGLLDPLTWVTGAGASALFGARAAIAAGQAGKAAAMVVGESVVGNLAYDALQQAMGEKKSLADYAISTMVGAVPGALMARGAFKQGLEAAVENAARRSIEQEGKLFAQAADELGRDATPEQVIARVEQMRNDAAREAAEAPHSAVSPENRIEAPDADNLLGNDMGEPKADATAPGPRDYASEVDLDQTIVNSTDKYKFAAMNEAGSGMTMQELKALPAGVHMDPTVKADVANAATWDKARVVLEALQQKYAPEGKYVLVDLNANKKVSPETNGQFLQYDKHSAFIQLRMDKPDWSSTLVHEFGHSLWDFHSRSLIKSHPALFNSIMDDWAKWFAKTSGNKDARRVLLERSSITAAARDWAQRDVLKGNQAGKNVVDAYGNLMDPNDVGTYLEYFRSFDEFAAEQFVKYIENKTLKGELKHEQRSLYVALKQTMQKILGLWRSAAKAGLIAPKESFQEFFDKIAQRQIAIDKQSAMSGAAPTSPSNMRASATPKMASTAQQVNSAALDARYGLNILPRNTPLERARLKVIRQLMARAEEWDRANPVDPKRLKTILDNRLVDISSPGHVLASSENPLARMLSGILVENAMGANGRRETAAIHAWRLNQEFVGDAIRVYDGAFEQYLNARGVSFIQRTTDRYFGKMNYRNEFNNEVLKELENRKRGRTPTVDPAISDAADAATKQFDLMRQAQVNAKTPGWGMLPASSEGYVPHRLDPRKISALDNAGREALHMHLREQLQQGLNDMDPAFADRVAGMYLQHAIKHAKGGHEVPANVFDPQAVDYMRQAMQAAGMTKDEVDAFANRLSAGGPSHTKQRLDLDLTRTFQDLNGGTHQLLDFYDTDVMSLLRRQARQVAGAVALINHGIAGTGGLKMIREALEATNVPRKVMDAFDQVAAEISGKPFGDVPPELLDRVLTLNASASLGGMGFTQIGESANFGTILGVRAMLHHIAEFPKMIAEVRALARGEKVDNPIVGSLEGFGGGGEYGLEGYKMVMPFDNPSAAVDSLDFNSLSATARIIRGASHGLGTLSAHRIINAVQRRGAAMETVRKVLRLAKEGNLKDKHLADMGFDEDLMKTIKASLKDTTEFGPDGAVKSFDARLLPDGAFSKFRTAVDRGVNQIIQSSLIGEKNKLEHSAFGRVLTQFRTFPLLAMEKQWGRNRAMHGVIGATAMIAAAMPFVLPVYFARVQAKAILMDEQKREEYLDKALSPAMLARSALNYISAAGLASDFMDALAAPVRLYSDDFNAAYQGSEGRSAIRTDNWMSNVAPALGWTENLGHLAKDPTNGRKWLSVLPLGNTPAFMLLNGYLTRD